MARLWRRATSLARLMGLFSVELLTSSARVVRDVLTPRDLSTPRVVDFPMRLRDPRAITLLANGVSLTPGTLALDVVDGALRVHAMYADDVERVREEIRRLEDALMALWEPES
ncbi:MAG: Na+/H+ antiporter subunit E [bacterium]|nr:Na+/H+ antiporter subunit E [Myxococcales bacterium]MCB9542867.1 Na+/H+ antiporter subunit E [Myxococcales bacterium]MCB9553707.1 Na+/H+ antiporter subunit E [Myxococcales bacterium]